MFDLKIMNRVRTYNFNIQFVLSSCEFFNFNISVIIVVAKLRMIIINSIE